MQQRSAEWFSARLGKVTASRINDVLATTKNGEAAARRNYKIQLVTERLTGEAAESFQSADMLWGIDQEDNAREAYEFLTDTAVEQVGFVDHPTIEMFGASPDGILPNGGILEIKCPKTATHIEWRLNGGVPKTHIPQMMTQMECTGALWGDFVSYDPRLPVNLQLYVARLTYDKQLAEKIRTEVIGLNQEIDIIINQLNGG